MKIKKEKIFNKMEKKKKKSLINIYKKNARHIKHLNEVLVLSKKDTIRRNIQIEIQRTKKNNEILLEKIWEE